MSTLKGIYKHFVVGVVIGALIAFLRWIWLGAHELRLEVIEAEAKLPTFTYTYKLEGIDWPILFLCLTAIAVTVIRKW